MPTDATLLSLLQLLCTAYMAGVIWFVQLVHYPMMAQFDRSRFITIQLEHQSRASRVVMLPMLLSLLCGILLVLIPQMPLTWWWPVGNLGLSLLWSGSTAFWQIPYHNRLAKDGFQPEVHQKLVRSNWFRTVIWTVQLIQNAAMLIMVGGSLH